MSSAAAEPALGPRQDARHLTWETALEYLDLEVCEAERLLADPAGAGGVDLEPWDRARVAGAIPAALAARALAIHARQLQVEADLVAALGIARRQHRFADRVGRATGRSGQAVYIDVQA